MAGILTATGAVTAGTAIGTLAASFAPSRNLSPIPIGISGVGVTYLAINGQTLSVGATLASTNGVVLDGIRFKLAN